MGRSKTLVVYYSRTGTTRKVAQLIASTMECDIEEVRDARNRRGPIGFLLGGKDAFRKKLTTIEAVERDPADYGLVIVGTPVWASTMTPAIRTYITRYRERFPDVAFFLTTGGSGIKSTFDDMRELCGREPRAVLGLKRRQVVKQDPTDAVRSFVEQLGR